MANGEDNVSATDSNISATNDKGLGAVRALLKKHSLNSAVIADGSKKYGARAFLATFPTPDISRNAYRRLKKVAAAFFPKREFNLSHSAKASASCRLIIRNLAWKVSEADIETVFSPFGPLESVHLPRDHKKSKGFCFVQYWSRDDAVRAVRGGNGLLIHERQIAVDYVSAKSTDTSSSSSSSSPSSSSSAASKKAKLQTENNRDGQEDSGSESDSDSNSDSGEEDSKSKRQASDETDNLTLFVRNIPYGTGEDELYRAFRPLGTLYYAKIVIDKNTNRSMGTAFVRFREQSSVAAALSHQPPLSVGGRELNVVRAISRDSANEIKDLSADQRKKRDKKEDKRHLYLAKEGKLSADMEEEVPKQDVMKRRNADKEKQTKLTNPNFFVSPTRLSVRNICTRPVKIPEDVGINISNRDGVGGAADGRLIDSKILRSIFLTAAKRGIRENLVRETEGDQALMPKTKTAWRHVRIVQAKVISESERGEDLISRGYGFVEFAEHVHALAALRMLNNNPHYFWCAPGPKANSTPHFRRNRLIVEFAVENAKKLAKRARKLEKQKQYRMNQGEAPLAKSRGKAASRASSSSATANSSSYAKTPKASARGSSTSGSREQSKNKRKESVNDRNSISESSKPRGVATANASTSPKRRKTREKDVKKKGNKKQENPVAAAAPASLVSSMAANAKRWFE